jgi:hypothetical protein
MHCPLPAHRIAENSRAAFRETFRLPDIFSTGERKAKSVIFYFPFPLRNKADLCYICEQ